MSETYIAFYRYRGSTGDWEYEVYGNLPVGKEIDEGELEEIAHDLLHQQGFHRVYVEQAKHPPLEWMHKQVQRAASMARYYAHLKDDLAAYLAQREGAELAHWEGGRMVEWCKTHDCEIAACDPLGNARSKCEPEVRIDHGEDREDESPEVAAD